MKVNKPLIILTIIFLVGITCIVFTAKSPYAAVLPYQIRIVAQNCGSYSVYMGKEVNNKYNRAFFSWLRERTNQCLVKAKENCQPANATVFHSDWLKGQGKITYTVKQK